MGVGVVCLDKYEKMFDELEEKESVFLDKSELDPLKEADEIIEREDKEKKIAQFLNGINQGYLPNTLSIYGSPGTGKTAVTKRVCSEFSGRRNDFESVYVNLKESKTLFSAANEILFSLESKKLGSYVGLDGVFREIWESLQNYPRYVVLILDEIDNIKNDKNYDPNDFFYRLIRGEGKQKREINLSLFLISNELLEVDLRLDSRVESAMSNEKIFFPPYRYKSLKEIIEPRLNKAFKNEALPEEVKKYGLAQAANRWGDVRKTLTLFRLAGETAENKNQNQNKITEKSIEDNLEKTEQKQTIKQIRTLPPQHFIILLSATQYINKRTGEIIQPITTKKIKKVYKRFVGENEFAIGDRAIREVINDLETMNLINTWIESKGKEGRKKQVETTFNPELMNKATKNYSKRLGDLEIRIGKDN